MAKYYVGWDVGAWHCDNNHNSRDAVVIQEENCEQKYLFYGNAMHFFERESIDDFFNAIFPECLPHSKNSYIIAIDAVLGWPIQFRELIAPEKISPAVALPSSKSFNPFLMRKTEMEIAKLIEKINRKREKDKKLNPPMSAVQDMLGSQSTKMIYFLKKYGFSCKEGKWIQDKSNGTFALETYPALFALLEECGEPCFQKTFKGYQKNESYFVKEGTVPTENNRDVVDACRCMNIAKRHCELKSPPEDISDLEGWIWLPKECWTDNKQLM